MMRFWLIATAAIIFTGLQIVIGIWVRRNRPPAVDERGEVRNAPDAWLWIVATTFIFVLLALMMMEAWSE